MTRSGQTKENKKSKRQSADHSRERIVSAARKVFAKHPYHIATVRMVGQAGGFDHQLISYYFPTKAELFEAVVAQTCDEFYLANQSWYEGISQMRVEDGFGLLIDRLLEYHFANPDALRIMALNAPLIERLDEIPGYQHIPEVLAKIRETFQENTGVAGSEDLNRYFSTFNIAIINYLGVAPGLAGIMGMEPTSDEYKTWVKQTLMYVFLPLLNKLIFPG